MSLTEKPYSVIKEVTGLSIPPPPYPTHTQSHKGVWPCFRVHSAFAFINRARPPYCSRLIRKLVRANRLFGQLVVWVWILIVYDTWLGKPAAQHQGTLEPVECCGRNQESNGKLDLGEVPLAGESREPLVPTSFRSRQYRRSS